MTEFCTSDVYLSVLSITKSQTLQKIRQRALRRAKVRSTLWRISPPPEEIGATKKFLITKFDCTKKDDNGNERVKKRLSRDDVVYGLPRVVNGSWPTRLRHVEKRHPPTPVRNSKLYHPPIPLPLHNIKMAPNRKITL